MKRRNEMSIVDDCVIRFVHKECVERMERKNIRERDGLESLIFSGSVLAHSTLRGNEEGK